MRHIIVVINEDGDEAMYVGGELVQTDGNTVYACDIASASGGEPFDFSHVEVNHDSTMWPAKFDSLVAYIRK